MLVTIKSFYDELLKDDTGHRYKSWEHCFNAFNKIADIEILSLHLAFYLASWGMYRGSSGLLWKDYTIHQPAVQIILKYPKIKSSQENLFPDQAEILNCFQELRNYYSSITYYSSTIKRISATDTLISKIMLGTLGNIPAFDRYFLLGAASIISSKTINTKSISGLYNYLNDKLPAIKECQDYILNESNQFYPPMKIIDMYFWQRGFHIEKEKSKQK